MNNKFEVVGHWWFYVVFFILSMQQLECVWDTCWPLRWTALFTRFHSTRQKSWFHLWKNWACILIGGPPWPWLSRWVYFPNPEGGRCHATADLPLEFHQPRSSPGSEFTTNITRGTSSRVWLPGVGRRRGEACEHILMGMCVSRV